MCASPALRCRRLLGASLLFLALAAVVPAQTPAPKAKAQTRGPVTPATGELVLHKWSGALNVPDPVACAVDPQGRVYVAATTRRKVGDLDIREHTMWIPDDVSFRTVADKQAFFRREAAPGKLRGPRGGFMDHNKDGSVDWQDLAHHTERIYQLRDTDGDGTADKMTVFAEGFATEVTGIAAGVMYHDGWVYATIAPDLWRFKDTDDDGVADIREVVVHGFGVHIAYAGHDMHGLMVGPDGRIYWSIGDKGGHVTSKEGKVFAFSNEGAVMRVDPDGSNFELYARGNRNIQEPAFNAFGDLIGVDNDADQPSERERFVFVPEGSDSGWRCNFQYMREDSPWMREGLWKPAFPGQPAYFLPPILSYSDGPAGFKHDPGTALGDGQRDLFLLNEFPAGKLKGFRAEPDGATYKMVDARVLNDGVMGIGASWHPDGSLFIADWMGGYPLDELGAVWRVDAKVGADNPARRETHALLRAGFAQRADDELVRLLAHRDQRVRQGAQLQLARRDRGAVFAGVAADAKADRLARIHALWGFGQLLRQGKTDTAPVAALLRDADPEIRRQVAKIFGDAAATGAKTAGAMLLPLLADASPRVRSLAAIALGKFALPEAVAPLLAQAAKDGADPALRQALVVGLAGCAKPAQLAAQATNPSLPARLVSIVALRRQGAPEVAAFLADAETAAVGEAARAIHDDEGIAAALPALAKLAASNPRDPALARRALNAGLRVGTAAAAERVLAFALESSNPAELRLEALGTLRVWNQPPRLDLVDGRARVFKPEPIQAVLTAKLDALLGLTDAALKTAAIEIMIAHALPAKPAQIAAIVADANAAGELRAQALRLMGGEAKRDPAFGQALDAALAATSPAPLHRAALALLLPTDAVRLVREAKVVLQTRSLPEQQNAYALLGRVGTPAADEMLAAAGKTLVAGTCPPNLKLDVLEALKARAGANPALAAQVTAYGATASAQALAELLAGGDAARGRDLVANHLAANCTACHAVESAGSEVGPNLRAIGNQRDAAYLLESLVNPAAKIATGYGIVAVTLKNKAEVTGTLAKETPEAVTVRLFDGKMRTIPRTEIAAQTPPASIMPPMLGILQPSEIRDVVTYLAGLKGGRGPRPAPKAEGGQ